MLKLFISQVKNLLKFTIALKEGNIEKAAAFYAEYKKASDASEIAVQGFSYHGILQLTTILFAVVTTALGSDRYTFIRVCFPWGVWMMSIPVLYS